MKHTATGAILSGPLLRFVRDYKPTIADFISRFGGHSGQVFHVLRKSGAIVVEGEHLRLNRRCLSPDGKLFVWGIKVIYLDEDRIKIVCREPAEPAEPSGSA